MKRTNGKIRRVDLDRIAILPAHRCDLREDQVVSIKICHDECRTPFRRSQVRERKRHDDDFTLYRFCHAASSSGVSQSRARTASLAKVVGDGLTLVDRRFRCCTNSSNSGSWSWDTASNSASTCSLIVMSDLPPSQLSIDPAVSATRPPRSLGPRLGRP